MKEGVHEVRWDGWLHVVTEGQMAYDEKRTEPELWATFAKGTSPLPWIVAAEEALNMQQFEGLHSVVSQTGASTPTS